jgi:GWxTD domain-containing protein
LRLAILLLICLTFASGCSSPAPTRGRFPGSDWFQTDVLLGIAESGQPLATITIAAPYRRLVFYRAPDGFRAPYRLRAILRSGRESLQAQEWYGEAWAEDYANTRGGLALQRTVTMELDSDALKTPGTYMEVQILVDGTTRLGVAEVPIEMGRFNRGGLVLGELALYRLRNRIDQVAIDLEVFGSALPHPDRFVRRNSGSFDYATAEPWVLVRVFDLRGERENDQLDLRVLVFADDANDPAWQRDLQVDRVGYETSIFLRLPTEAFAFGRNRVEVRLAGSEPVAAVVENLGLDLSDTPSWKANLKQIEVLASEEEFAEMESIPGAQRQEVWEEFWERRDPDPETPENPRLEEHYDRVAYARAFLRDGFDDGALSDRGRIWVLHGRPDTIDNSSPGFENYGSYEVWRYRQIGLAYYFRDIDGLGRFRLVWQEEI